MSKKINQDKHQRSIVKATTWRVIATCDTIFLSWLFTGQITTALKIGISEVFTKIGLFYLHERIWGGIKLGRTAKLADGTFVLTTTEKQYRSLIKGISWRFFGTLDTIILAFLWTGDFTKAFAIGGTEIITKVGLYWIHERVWLKVKWGRVKEVTPVPEVVFETPALEPAAEVAKPSN